MGLNIAGGNGFVPVQGKVKGDPDASRKAAEAAERAQQKAAKVVNIRTGNARVGRQGDVHGDVTIRM